MRYYKQNDFENAISQFNKIINGKILAQNAYYHLGESYLKLDKKQFERFKMLLKCRLTLQSRKTRV
jgi:TolA-binding protein